MMLVILPDGAKHSISSTLAADTIARNLRTFGYPDVTDVEVQKQLAKPASERSIIGMMAYRMLEENGLVPVDS